MPTYPSLEQIIAYVSSHLGPATNAGPGLLRWWVHAQPGGQGVALWAPSGLHDGLASSAKQGQPHLLWVTRPFRDDRESCPVTSLAHLSDFLHRVRSATQVAAPPDVKGLCPKDQSSLPPSTYVA